MAANGNSALNGAVQPPTAGVAGAGAAPGGASPGVAADGVAAQRAAGLDAQAALQTTPPNSAATADGNAGTLVMPTPVPLGRETRDPAGAARVAAQQHADNLRQLEDSQGQRPGQEMRNARVTEADLGVAFLPRSAQDRAESSRVSEPGYGQTTTTVLRSATTVDAALAFYRQELQNKLPGFQVTQARTGPSFATLTALQSPSGSRLTVFVNETAPGEVAVSLSRWQAAATAPPASPSGGN